MNVVPQILLCGGTSSCRHMPTGAEENVAYEETSVLQPFRAMRYYT